MARYVYEWLAESPEDRQKRKDTVCRKCRYSANACESSKNTLTQVQCDYIMRTGHMRGCSPIDCKRFELMTDEPKRKPNNSIKYDNGVRIR